MMNDSIGTTGFQPGAVADERLFDSWFDPIEHAVRDRVRSFIEELIEGERSESIGLTARLAPFVAIGPPSPRVRAGRMVPASLTCRRRLGNFSDAGCAGGQLVLARQDRQDTKRKLL